MDTTSFIDIEIRTERLLLRPVKPEDRDAIFAIHADPENMEFWSTPPWTDIGKADQMIISDQEAHSKGESLRLGLELLETGECVGFCSLFDLNRQCRRAEVGYILSRHCWNQGLMSEALKPFVDMAFEELDLHRLVADIDPRNLSSAKLLKKFGFVCEGHLREHWIIGNEICDSHFYGLLSHEWAEVRKKII